MKSWKDYNVLRESTPVEDRDRIAKEMTSLEAMHDPELAGKNLRARSYDKNEGAYQRAVSEVAKTIRACMESLGLSEKIISSTFDINELYDRFDLEDWFVSLLNEDISLYFNGEDSEVLADVSSLKDFTRKVAQGRELPLSVETFLNPEVFAGGIFPDMDFFDLSRLDTNSFGTLSKKQTNLIIRMIDESMRDSNNPCRALKEALNKGLITLSYYTADVINKEWKLCLAYNFFVSSKMSERDKNLIIRAMKDIVDFTEAFNCIP